MSSLQQTSFELAHDLKGYDLHHLGSGRILEFGMLDTV